MYLAPRRQVLDCASPLALSDLVRGRKSGRGLPQSKTLARQRPPRCGSWSQCMRESERRLSMNRPTPDPSQEGSEAFVRVLSVPLLGGVRGGFMVPMHPGNEGRLSTIRRAERQFGRIERW